MTRSSENTQPIARSVMIAGEMLNWSDLKPSDGRPALSGSAAAALVGAAVGAGTGSVLVAGPHSFELLELITERATSVDVLVRSAPDADQIAEALDVRVFCGSLDHFGPEHGVPAYDVVVALDGLDRLVGPDTLVLTWADALAALQARVAPTGNLLLAAENSFGLERLIQPDPTTTVPRDEAWPRDLTGDAAPPVGLKAVTAAMVAAGLSGTQTYAVYPSPVDADTALTDVTGPLAAAAVARSVATRFAGLTLTDPYRTASDALAAGLGLELAPAWYFVTGTATLPRVLPEDAVPPGKGELLEEALFAALRIDDEASLRRTVRAYVAWLLAQNPDVAAVASPDNVIADGASYRVFADGVVAAGNGDALVLNHFARFVRRSLEAGSRQPWSAGSTPRDVTARLASIVGITVTDELWNVVVDGNEIVRPAGTAELLATIARLSQELSDASRQATWFEDQLHGIRRSLPYRVGHAVLNPARVVVRRIRRMTGR
ncbi:MAG TPA: hypothetical protein VFI00_17215 [Kribbella sp.]|nr:hypothetical protein [Kribbella sp.]